MCRVCKHEANRAIEWILVAVGEQGPGVIAVLIEEEVFKECGAVDEKYKARMRYVYVHTSFTNSDECQ